MRRTAAWRVALATIVCTLGLPFAAPTPASSAPAPAGSGVGVHLVSQTPWVPLHETFAMFLAIDDAARAARPGAAIAIRVHANVITRTGFDHAVADQELGGTVQQTELPVAALPRIDGNLVVGLGLPGSSVTPTIPIGRPGVYPVEVSLIDETGTPADSFVTWATVVDPDATFAKPLLVSWVMQVVADPSRLPDGSIDPAVAAQLKAGGRLDDLASVLQENDELPVSLLAGPETLEAWAELASHDSAYARGIGELRAAAKRATTDLLAAPYVPIDGTALRAAGLGSHLPEEFVKGSEVLDTIFGSTPSNHRQTTLIDPVDDALVDQLRQMLVTRVAVRDASLVPVTHRFTPDEGFQLATPLGSAPAVSTAPFLETLLTGTDAPALKSARVVAALAEIAYENPGVQRGVVIAPPARWDADPAMMKAISSALETMPILKPVTLDNLFAQINFEKNARDKTEVQRRLAPTNPAPGPVNATDYDATVERLRSYAAVVGTGDPVVVDGQRALLAVLSTAITPDRARAELARIDATVKSFSSGISVEAKRITLTSRTATIPLSFQNDLKPPRTVQVRVHLASPKLVFPTGNDQVIELAPGLTTADCRRDSACFKVEARTSGTFPMSITLTSVDGGLTFGRPVSVTVRSTVFGGFAVALTVGALLFLALWWGNHVRRTRRSRRAARPAVP